MSVNSTSTYVNSASSNKGFSGLASGLDTESMVEQLLSGTQSKIDKQNGLKQQIVWKQEIYRDIISQLNTFQNQFFGSSSSTNMMSSAFFNAISVMSSSNAFKVTASCSASVGNTNLEVRQLASNASVTSGAGVSGKLRANISDSAINNLIQEQIGEKSDYLLQFKVGDEVVETNLQDLFITEDGKSFKTYANDQERDEAIQQRLEEAFAKTDVTVTVKDGKVQLSAPDNGSISVSADSGKLGLERLGMSAGQSSAKGKLDSKIDDMPKLTFSVTLDDLRKDINIDLRKVTTDGKLDMDKLLGTDENNIGELQKQLNTVHGTNQVIVKRSDDGNGFELQVAAGRKVMVNGSQDVLSAMDLKNGQANRITMYGTLKDLYFAEELQGSQFKFTINGVKFSFSGDTEMDEVINTINRSDAGVRLVYRAQDDTFSMELKESGAGREITMSQEQGNLLSALFGKSAGATGSSVASKQLGLGSLKGSPVLTGDDLSVVQGDFTMNVNGKKYTFSLPKRAQAGGGAYDKEDIISELNKQFDKQFGEGNIRLKEDGTLSVTDGSVVTLPATETKDASEAEIKNGAKAGNLNLALFGAEEITNAATEETTLSDLGLTGILDKDGNALSAYTKLSELSEKTGGALSFEDGRIVLNDASKITDSATTEKLFGTKNLNLNQATGVDAVVKEGQNAVVKIDGVLTERGSNNFSVNGLNITLTGTTGDYAKGMRVGKTDNGEIVFPPEGFIIDENGDVVNEVTGEYKYDASGAKVHYPSWEYRDSDGKKVDGAVGMDGEGYLIDKDKNRIFAGKADSIETTRNTDQVIEGVKQFMDAYNKIVKTLNDYLEEDTNYREYAPLTDAQKKEMSEKEITLWEEKSKQGLLRNDSTIESFLQSMRSVLYEKPEGCPYALYELGIETGGWESKGQLVFSTDGEARLRQILESDPTAVEQLFCDPVNGLATKMNTILDKTAKTSSGSPGELVKLAGVKGKATETDNTLTTRLKEIDEKIAALKRTYEKEKTRYWNQFNAMEQVISNMSAQSSWLLQQFSGN